MPFRSKQKDSFEDAAHKLYGGLVQLFLILVLIANILAYAFSEKYRSTFPLGKFVLCTLGWTGLTVGFWWMRRSVGRLKGPFRPRRPTSATHMEDRQ